MSEEVLVWECPYCGKVIKSLYKRQLEYNKQCHLMTHEVQE
ncbi:MAG: hypothetical protein QW794_04015 [Thermosphaera sp.]